MMIRSTVLETPIGPLALLALDEEDVPQRAGSTGGDVLVAAGFTADPTEMHVRLHPSLRSYGLEGVDDLAEIGKAHEAYFAGDLTALDTLTVYQPGPPRREALWAALREVPAGHTITYGELATRAGLERTAARAAGQACAQNLVAPVVPCHRILPAGGPKRFGGYYYGVDRKEWLLRHEADHR